MKRFAIVAIGTLVVIGLSACVPGTSNTSQVTGEVIVPKNGAFPVGTTLVLRITEAGSPDGAVLAESSQRIVPGWEAPSTHPPIAFQVPYDPAKVDPARAYVISVSAEDSGRTLAASKERPVITRGGSVSGIELTLEQPDVTPEPRPMPPTGTL